MNTLDKVAANPSGWDSTRNYMGGPLSELSHEYVVMTRTRDASFLEQHNWDEALNLLGGEGEEVTIHRFGHWACGWWEALCVQGSKIAQGEAIEQRLDNYPILNEDGYSEKEWNAAQEYWEQLSIEERVELCQQAGVNVFAARHGWIPQSDDQGFIFERCKPE